jgi:hypothetical protein
MMSESKPKSPSQSGCWRVALDMGREPFSTMPSSWAKSGARFPLVIKCNFTDHGIVSAISGDVRYTAAQGEMVTPVEPGTWKLSDDNRKLSFTLNFPDMIERNGVKIGRCTIPVKAYFTLNQTLMRLIENSIESDLSRTMPTLNSRK